jgi:hypothetical protein
MTTDFHNTPSIFTIKDRIHTCKICKRSEKCKEEKCNFSETFGVHFDCIINNRVPQHAKIRCARFINKTGQCREGSEFLYREETSDGKNIIYGMCLKHGSVKYVRRKTK